MYTRYFNFDELPFSISPDPHFIYMSPRHKEGLAHLLYGIRMGGGFVALTGEVGTGKTTLCHCLLQQIPDDIDLAFILNPKLNAPELLASICEELDITITAEQSSSLKVMVDTLSAYLLSNHAKGRRTVLIIDEAQNLSFEVLEQIRLLTNLETHKSKLLQIILVGQPELKTLLSHQNLRQLNQRITARYHLTPLSLKETRQYIQHRLSVCHGNPKLFKAAAIRKIHKLSKGIPRLINLLCDRALLGTYTLEEQFVKAKTINKAAVEVLPPMPEKNSPVLLTFLLTTLAFVSLAFIIFRYDDVIEPMFATAEVPQTPIIIVKKKSEVTTNEQVGNQGVTISDQTPPAEASTIIPATEPSQIPKVADDPVPEPAPSLKQVLDNPGFTIQSAIAQTLKIWGHQFTDETKINCKLSENVNMHCLYDKGGWNNIISLNRPTILEFILTDGKLRYGLLIGLRQGQPIIRFKEDYEFSLQEVLSLWNGHYLILWNPPLPNMVNIYPDTNSSRVLWLREQLNQLDSIQSNTKRPRYFDKKLKSRVIIFQQQHQLTMDGVVGPRTFIQLNNKTASEKFPKLEITD